MSVPMKFREIGDFHEYYSGARKARYLTLFVGGNHEASSHLFELYHGGWVAPNIYYLGAASVVCLGPLRIAGLSGIWKGYNYNKPHHERLPHNQDDIKSIYHVRELDVRKLLQIRTQVDVGISHDWPRGVEWLGDWKGLFAKKDLFEADARAGTLGSSAAKYVMDRLRPPHWFAAHMHCKFSAVVNHGGAPLSVINGASNDLVPSSTANGTQNNEGASIEISSAAASNQGLQHNEDEIDLDSDDNGNAGSAAFSETAVTTSGPSQTPEASSGDPSIVPEDLRAQLPASFAQPAPQAPPLPLPAPEAITNTTTRFLALDKCLPHRKFLQFLEIEPISDHSSSSTTRPHTLSYDKEWLAITRVFASDLILGDLSSSVPLNRGAAHYRPLIETEEAWVEENLVKTGRMTIPEDFEITAPVYDPAVGIGTREQPEEYTNPQTVRFCELVGIHNPFDMSEEERERRRIAGPREDSRRGGGGKEDGRGGRGGRWGGRGRGGRGPGRGRGR
ncbi:hypothetical protein MMC30_008983 [Trapelia coarctata]|nr:hypothetical protein [Trapelia coarctata]